MRPLVLCHRIVIDGAGKLLTAHQADPVACSIGEDIFSEFPVTAATGPMDMARG
jgi:hypothetical protein